MFGRPRYVAVGSAQTSSSEFTTRNGGNITHIAESLNLQNPDETASSESFTHDLDVPPRVVKWGMDWRVTTKMFLLFISGMALAMGHHYYYHSLAGTIVFPSTDETSEWNLDRQAWKIRFGTAFAFLVKACLATVIVIAYNQYVWIVCKKRSYSISGLDALFSATTDMFALANPELSSTAKMSTLLAALVW